MPIKLKKTLYVGLGGTGVSTLLKIKKCFIDSYGEIPPMIGFLAIDTDSAAENKSETSSHGENIKLEKTELLVCTVRGALNVYHNHRNTYDWVPSQNVNSLDSIQGFGAGQVRSNGRFIAYYNHQTIKSNIQTAITKISKPLPIDSLYEIDTNRSNATYPTNINVFASIAGGTGSGMLIDVLVLIREALEQNAQDFRLYPWIVLPEVFRAMNSGPSMYNVLYNSYGALRSLDYIKHHNFNGPAINFGYATIDKPLFDYAYVINNTNLAGVSFSDIDDLTDVIAKSAFLPANKMGDDLQSPFDNIVAQMHAPVPPYNILNKTAWAASVGSAELIYDGQMVGKARAYAIIRQLCESMLQSPTDGSADANNFFDDQNVMIRENNGRDDIINTLLSPAPMYTLQIDENTTEFDINNYIEENCGQTKLERAIKEALEKKLDNTQTFFEKYITEIMNRPQGKVDGAIKFIQALFEIITICKKEMIDEEKDFHNRNSIPEQWDVLLNAVKKKGIRSLMDKIDTEAIEVLQNKLAEVVTNRREETRRSWALKFYISFESLLKKKLQEIEGLKSNLEQISKSNTQKLLKLQNAACSTSKFQIFLHEQDILQVSNFMIDSAIRTHFVQFLNGGVSSWIGDSSKNIESKLKDFASTTSYVKAAIGISIDSVLQNLPEEQVKAYLDHLKTLASPLWTYNTQGYNDRDLELDHFIIVGVGNRNTSVLSQSPLYNTHFDTNKHQASFASTNQNDRVYLLVVEDLLPIYAVNNFTAYLRDTEDKLSRGRVGANYLDEKLYNRMNAENFSVIPTIESDDVLQYWVWGFVFGFIHYDEAEKKYWVRSKAHGDALRKYRYDLSNQRDVAYDMFKSEHLYKEVEEGLNRQIDRSGRQTIEDKINEIKAEESYLDSYAQLSPWERSNLNEQNFQAVRRLLEQEIALMSE